MKKKVFDVIHKFIDLQPWETKLLKTLPLKRLSAIHQIGSAAFVYGGGDHKRFDHSLGTMFVSTKIYDTVIKYKESAPQLKDDLTRDSIAYWRKVLRAASLCHDIGHLPFSHLAEEILLGKNGHEKWTMKIIRSPYLTPIWEEAGLDVEHIVKVSVGEKVYEGSYTPWERVVSEMLTGDFFGGDRIDYLLRDSYFTGLAYGSFDYLQLIDSLRILPVDDNVVLGVREDGLESCYSLLLARYFMHKRLYQYPQVKAYSYHLREFIRAYFEGKPYLESVDEFLKINDFEILAEINRAQFDESHSCYSHARAIMDQSPRISVFSITKKDFDSLVKEVDIDWKKIVYEKNPLTQRIQGLSFPVLMKNDMVIEAQEITDVNIPVYHKNWLYIQPEHSRLVSKKLDDNTRSPE